MKGMTATIDNTFSSISPSYNSNGVVDDFDLSKVQLLTLYQVKRIKCIVQNEKLAGNVKGLFLQNLKPVIKRAITDYRFNFHRFVLHN